jgi:hypothetical protein
MRIEVLSAGGLDPVGDACILVTHGLKIKSKARSPKSKVAVAAGVRPSPGAAMWRSKLPSDRPHSGCGRSHSTGQCQRLAMGTLVFGTA